MATTPSNDARDLRAALMAGDSRSPMRHRPHPDTRVLRAVEKVRDLLSTVPEELVDRDTLQALLMAADDGRYAQADAERYHGLWMEAQDECRRLAHVTVLNVGEGQPEPPDHAVVIDSEGDAWQRDDREDGNTGPGWYCAGGTAPFTWADLLDGYGPVTLVYVP